MEKLIIKNSRTAKRLSEGHLWIFANEVFELPELLSGSLVSIFDQKGTNYGLGFYNRNSLIAIRLLKSDTFDFTILNNRISDSYNQRRRLFNSENSYRLVFGESDFLPGLIIDKFEKYFSIQIFSAGFENFKSEIITSLLEIFPETKGIIFRNDIYWRKIEGLSLIDELGFGTIPDNIEINENGIKYSVSLTTGQKTGYFFDQRLNRQFLCSIAKDCKVLDLFSNQGGFALNASKGNASQILGVDISESSCTMARYNAEINSFHNPEFLSADVFEFLKSQIEENKKWDIIISDPPAFAKNKKSIPSALIAYRRLNKLAMKILSKNGILLTSSCSQHIEDGDFLKEIQKAANELGKTLIQIYKGNQSPDHPILLSMKETNYLKFYGFIVL